MIGSLLVNFFQYGRSAVRPGGAWHPNEDHDNAMHRNLSLMKTDDLRILQQQAEDFAQACNDTVQERQL